MTTPQKQDTPPDAEAQRDALLESERKAAEHQPDSFMDKSVTDKVVEIPPVRGTDGKPLQGLDPT